MGILSNILKFISDNSNASSENSRYKSPSGGYMNYAVFSVKGVNPATNRKKALKFECKTADVAKQLAINAGLINIESVTVIPFDPPFYRTNRCLQKTFKKYTNRSLQNRCIFLNGKRYRRRKRCTFRIN